MLLVLLAVVACAVFVVGGHVKRLAAAVEEQNRHYGIGPWNDDVAHLIVAAKVVVRDFGWAFLHSSEGKDLRDAILRVEGGVVSEETVEAAA